jgi:hypothetical protein
VLAADARIKGVAVVPVPDDIREEEVFACVVAESHVVPSLAVVSSILSDTAARLTYYKLPGYTVFVQSGVRRPQFRSIHAKRTRARFPGASYRLVRLTELIGAIGVSADTKEHDAQIAQAGSEY